MLRNWVCIAVSHNWFLISFKTTSSVLKTLRPRLHDTVFISHRIGFISDWPSVYTIPFSFHIGLASRLHGNAPIRYASYRFLSFQMKTPGGGTIHILGTGTCHREGYRFSRFWYKGRYRFSRIWYKERYHFSRFSQLVLDPVSIFGKLV